MVQVHEYAIISHPDISVNLYSGFCGFNTQPPTPLFSMTQSIHTYINTRPHPSAVTSSVLKQTA